MIVYYSNTLNVFPYEIEPLLPAIFKIAGGDSFNFNAIKKCPATKKFCNNTFIVKNFIDYDLNLKEGLVYSKSRDQKFFNDYIVTRSVDDALFSYGYPGHIFFAEKPLLMEVMPPFLHDSEIVSKTMMVPGTYDIGKHFRTVDFAFQFKQKKDSSINFIENDPLFYARFNTEEKIIFKKFYYTSELKQMMENILSLRDGKNIKQLQYWYDMFTKNYKKRVLKSITNNLI